MGNKEEVEMPDGHKYLLVRGDEYLRFNRVTAKYEVVVQETIFRYDHSGEVFQDCYTNEVVLDYDASDRLIFEFKLKGRTEPDFPENPE